MELFAFGNSLNSFDNESSRLSSVSTTLQLFDDYMYVDEQLDCSCILCLKILLSLHSDDSFIFEKKCVCTS